MYVYMSTCIYKPDKSTPEAGSRFKSSAPGATKSSRPQLVL